MLFTTTWPSNLKNCQLPNFLRLPEESVQVSTLESVLNADWILRSRKGFLSIFGVKHTLYDWRGRGDNLHWR